LEGENIVITGERGGEYGYWIGSSDFDKIFENGLASCSFELAKDI
jgi:hypothetical protein